MKQTTKYQNKKVLVIGMGMSGVNVALLLKKLGAQVTINDKQDHEANDADVIKLQQNDITVITGSHPLSLVDEGFELVVKNPGIPYDNVLVNAFNQKKIPIVTEVEIAASVFEGQLVAVTGSNGKTTTTTMITKILQHAKQTKVHAAGNIGISFSDVVESAEKQDTIVAELSSFQLAGTINIKPHVAVITNIFSNHLDYHKTRENYVAAKMKITANQTADDFFVINYDRTEWQQLATQSLAQVVPFSRQNKTQTGTYLKNGNLCFKDETIMPAKDLATIGDQNIENALAAIAATKILGVANEDIVAVLTTFSGVRHRLQYVLEYQGRKFYNDSKATDIEATQMALAGFKQPVILLAGGLDRGYTFEKLVPAFKAHVKAIVVSGQSAKKMADAAKQAGIKQIEFAKDCVEGVPQAYALSDPGDVILLSPANASWDQFENFEVRGNEYIEAIEKLSGKKEQS